MVVQAAPAFRAWLKQSTNMKLSTNSAVTRILHEGITDIDSLIDFDKDSIEALPKACSRAIDEIEADEENEIEAEDAVPAGNISIASVHRLIVAANAARYYRDIGRNRTVARMHYNNILANFKVDHAAYITLKRQDAPQIPLVNDKDRDKKVIKWVPLFEDAMSRTFGSKGPLKYVLRETADVPDEEDDPLANNSYYSEEAGSLLEELVARLPHTGPTYRDDNKTVFMAIAKAVAGTSVESTIKSFSRSKDGRGAFQALISNHAGDIKYRSIVKSRMNLLTNIKWNGRSYALETHVSNHRQAVDDLNECEDHINNQVPDDPQRVEYLIDSITCQDSALQAAIGNIRADSNGMRSDFESAASHIMEVDPYKRTMRNNGRPSNRSAQISDARFTAGRGGTGVDLRWYPRSEFLALPDEQKDELTKWQRTTEGKKAMRKEKKRKSSDGRGSSPSSGGAKNESWKRKFKKSLKTANGLAHVMAVMAEEENSNTALVASLTQAPLPPPPLNPPAAAPSNPDHPTIASVNSRFHSLATRVQLNSILKNKK